MTLMTHAQVGDWTHDTTGPAKDIYVTGNVFVGKERGRVVEEHGLAPRLKPRVKAKVSEPRIQARITGKEHRRNKGKKMLHGEPAEDAQAAGCDVRAALAHEQPEVLDDQAPLVSCRPPLTDAALGPVRDGRRGERPQPPWSTLVDDRARS